MTKGERLEPQEGPLTTETCQIRPLSLGEQIVTEARRLVGVRFYHTGRDEHGLDCAGLILCCWHRLGLTTWDDRNYAPGGDVKRLRAGLERFCDPVERDQIQAGDALILLMRGHPIHAGLVTGEGTLIHALNEGRKQVIEVPLDEHWRKRIVSVWRWREG